MATNSLQLDTSAVELQESYLPQLDDDIVNPAAPAASADADNVGGAIHWSQFVLPHGWRAVVLPDGPAFYVHKASRRTQWDVPMTGTGFTESRISSVATPSPEGPLRL